MQTFTVNYEKVNTTSKELHRFVPRLAENQPYVSDLYFKATDFPTPPEAFTIEIKPTAKKEGARPEIPTPPQEPDTASTGHPKRRNKSNAPVTAKK